LKKLDPHITIILPVRNEADFIMLSLGSVLKQDYPQDKLEVIVADGMSDDGTREIIQELQAEHPNLHMVDNPRRIVPTGLNTAIRQARGEIIVRVDGHCEIAPNYVRQCVSALERSGAENVGGRMHAVSQNTFGRAVAAATSTPFGVGGARFHYSLQEEWVDTVYLGAWRKTTFTHIGLFDEELVRDQDDEFNYRLRAHGGKILLSPLIRSTYVNRSRPIALWRQYYQYSYWKVRVLQKHPRQMQPRQFIPPAFVAALLGLGLLCFFIPTSRHMLLSIMALYVLANLAASVWTAARWGWAHLPLLPFVYAILHLGYGLGFLVGLVRFANRWGDRQGQTPSWKDARSQTAQSN
jgi:succinoglycan biosynthesis protein ExoA